MTVIVTHLLLKKSPGTINFNSLIYDRSYFIKRLAIHSNTVDLLS